MKTGNTPSGWPEYHVYFRASMEPGHEDREYRMSPRQALVEALPQWSPVMKTGNTTPEREYVSVTARPQWSPVMKTGNTGCSGPTRGPGRRASMEPGHEDREYGSLASVPLATSVAHSCEDCHSAPPADGRERRQGRQEPALTRARALSGDPIGTRALARQSGILSWGAACGVRRT